MHTVIPLLLLVACNGGNKPAPDATPAPAPAPDMCAGLDPEQCWASDDCLLDQPDPHTLVCREPADQCDRAMLEGGSVACAQQGCVYQAFPCFCAPGMTCVCGGGAPPRCLDGPPRNVARVWAVHGDVRVGLAGPDVDVVVLRGPEWVWVVPHTGTGDKGPGAGHWPVVAADPAPVLAQADQAFAADSAARGADAWRDAFAPSGAAWDGTGFAHGPDAVADVMADGFGRGITLTWEPAASAMTPDGVLGMTVGPYEIRDGDDAESGVYVTVWRKRSDGTWGVALDFPATP